ncbi:MAG: response regulator transcription factor [Ardenticatenaceae bacterium]|nr:response regulator transcription factor [Ardenticatenaceae bacterium]MCB9445272.1 response regulator transcription factor [Ardenticatenaceae bacterium]
MSEITLILADDHTMVRSGLRMLLEAQSDMRIVGEAENGTEAVRMALSLRPGVVLMDVQMPDMNGIEATRKIKEIVPETAVLALTIYEDDQYFFEMLKAGASGYIPKRAAPDDLVSAIRTVACGEVYLFPTLAAHLVQDFVNRQGSEMLPVNHDLTSREQEVLTLIAEGYTNAVIGEKLEISVKTVDRHRENIMRKLNMHTRVELVKYAIRVGLIDLEES